MKRWVPQGKWQTFGGWGSSLGYFECCLIYPEIRENFNVFSKIYKFCLSLFMLRLLIIFFTKLVICQIDPARWVISFFLANRIEFASVTKIFAQYLVRRGNICRHWCGPKLTPFVRAKWHGFARQLTAVCSISEIDGFCEWVCLCELWKHILGWFMQFPSVFANGWCRESGGGEDYNWCHTSWWNIELPGWGMVSSPIDSIMTGCNQF